MRSSTVLLRPVTRKSLNCSSRCRRAASFFASGSNRGLLSTKLDLDGRLVAIDADELVRRWADRESEPEVEGRFRRARRCFAGDDDNGVSAVMCFLGLGDLGEAYDAEDTGRSLPMDGADASDGRVGPIDRLEAGVLIRRPVAIAGA